MSNHVSLTFSGRLARDPEARFFEGGSQVVNLSIPLDVVHKRDDQQTIWASVAIWGKDGQYIADYARKGHTVTISGRITKAETFETRQGEVCHKIEVRADQATLLTSKAEAEAMAGGQGQAPRAAVPGYPRAEGYTKSLGPLVPLDGDDDSVPF